jgi:purine-nucleoside phosphorylase
VKSRVPSPASTAALLAKSLPVRPELAIQLGTGFGGVADAVTVLREWSYGELPGFPEGRVPGHAGRLILGRLGTTPVWVLCGRAHYYEGFSMEAVTFPVRTLASLGVTTLLLTNAAGGIRQGFRTGDFMALSDHINLMGVNPLRGPAPPGQSRFLDCHDVYDPLLRRTLKRAARAARVRCHEGIYLAVSGPSFETPAEIRAFARLGADAVGMSTVPEALMARQLGLRVVAISAITNPAAGLGVPGTALSHEAVLDQAATRESVATRLVTALVQGIEKLKTR